MSFGPVDEVLRLQPTTSGLFDLLSRLSGRPREELELEVKAHLGVRITFLLLGELAGASNYEVMQRRLQRVLGSDLDVTSLTSQLARILSCVGSADVRRKAGLQDLPYPLRRRLLERQGGRCGVCGWGFDAGTDEMRTPWESRAALDHIVPIKLAGDELENLRVLCGLCNAIKEATVHVGEHGRVWSNNHVYMARRRAVAFWTMLRDGRCGRPDCRRGPWETRLYVERRGYRGAWALDNCVVRCDRHMSPGEFLSY